MGVEVDFADSRILREILDRAHAEGFEEGRRRGFVEGVKKMLDRFRPTGTRT